MKINATTGPRSNLLMVYSIAACAEGIRLRGVFYAGQFKGYRTMNLSGIVVFVPPARLAENVAALNALEGVEVHHTQAESGKIVVVQEAASVHDEIEGLKRIKALPGVIAAELVYHYFAEDSNPARDADSELSALDGMELERIPKALRDHPGDDLLDVSS